MQLGALGAQEHWGHLQQLARVTALKQAPDGHFHLGHWWRGPLLYSLVQRLRPRHMLEIGTGRGYGALAMAQAAVDAGLDGAIWTIDRVAPDQRQPWAIDEGQGPRVLQRSRQEVWEAHVSPALRERVRCWTGDAATLMGRWHREGGPRVDFCFVDGEHDRWSVKRDFIAALKIADPSCCFLFDDYTERRGYGVRRLIDRDVAPRLPPHAVEIIDMGAQDETAFGERVAHEMALVCGVSLGPAPVARFYARPALAWFERLAACRDHFQRMTVWSRNRYRACGVSAIPHERY